MQRIETLLGLLTILGLGQMGLGCTDSAEPPIAPSTFAFTDGRWAVESRYLTEDGTFETTTWHAVVTRGVGQLVWKEFLRGMRNGQPVEVYIMRTWSDSERTWILGMADGAASTFDILDGQFTDGQGVFQSQTETRPDGGRTRITYTSLSESGFAWYAERFDEAGQIWERYWELTYTPTDAGPPEGPFVNACDQPEHRAFDFWLGDWRAFTPEDQPGGRNLILSKLGGCLIEENWSSGAIGLSYNMYDVRTGLWYQFWQDTEDTALVTQGGLVDNRIILNGRRASGLLQRISWMPRFDGSVRQRGSFSNDGGQTYQTSYDFTYRPR